MKILTVLLVALFSVFVMSCNQQKVNIPEKVQASFSELFPTASEVEWEMTDDNEWEAEFEMNGKEASACFTITGEWIETEYELENLPETNETILMETYPGFEISEVEVVESPEFYGYEVQMKNGEEEIEILITAEGEIQEVEMDIEEAENEDSDEG